MHTHTHTYTHIPCHILFRHGLSQDTEHSSLCSAGGPRLPTLHRVVCIQSFLSPLPLMAHSSHADLLIVLRHSCHRTSQRP